MALRLSGAVVMRLRAVGSMGVYYAPRVYYAPAYYGGWGWGLGFGLGWGIPGLYGPWG